jgi:hypothetical protein
MVDEWFPQNGLVPELRRLNGIQSLCPLRL